MSYDKQLYEAYGYSLDEGDAENRVLLKAFLIETTASNLLKLLVVLRRQHRGLLITPRILTNAHVYIFLSKSEKLPVSAYWVRNPEVIRFDRYYLDAAQDIQYGVSAAKRSKSITIVKLPQGLLDILY